jgi:rubredoxin
MKRKIVLVAVVCFMFAVLTISAIQVHTEKWVCTVCGYVYDPEKGDPESGIAAGTPFVKLPADWVCPVCGASKSDFERESD